MNKMHPDKILLVDDTPANLTLLTEILQREGYQILAAKDGQGAIKIASHMLPDLILLDIMMPGIDGYETCRQLKNKDETKDIPVIFISAKTDVDDLVRGFSVGGVDYINKPFREAEVCARIASQIKIQALNQKLTASESDMRQLVIEHQNQSNRLQNIVELVVDGILETNGSGIIQLVNPAVEQLFGYSVEELQSINFTQLLAEPYATQYELLLADNTFSEQKHVEIMGKNNDGHEFPIEFSLLKVPAREETFLVVIHDITLQKDKEEKLRNLSYVDPLTDLANRRHFVECFTKEWLQAQRMNKPVAFIMIDIDWFKQYNDNYGHQSGDDCLVNIAAKIKNCIKRPSDIVARLGGEEFAIILPDTPEDGVIQVAEQLREDVQAMKIPHKASSYGVVTISLGIAIAKDGENCHSPDELYQMADKALYQAKQSGRNQFKIYT